MDEKRALITVASILMSWGSKMKKFILAMSAIIGFSVIVFALPVNECKTDIYFGNGVWNTEKSADISR